MHCRGNPFKFYDPNMNSGESAIWVFAVWRCAIMLNVSNWEEYVCESNSVHLDASHDRIYYAFSEPSKAVFGCHFHNNVYILYELLFQIYAPLGMPLKMWWQFIQLSYVVMLDHIHSVIFRIFLCILMRCGNNILNLNRDILCETYLDYSQI